MKSKKQKAKSSKRHLPHKKRGRQSLSQSYASSLQGLLQQALTHHRAGRLAQAQALYRQILQVKPNHFEALHYSGMLAFQSGKPDIAVAQVKSALALQPDYVEALNNLGIILQSLGKADEAVAHFQRALALQPDSVDVIYNLGKIFQSQNKLDEAALCYRRALILRPDYAEAHFNLANVLDLQNKQDEAIDCYRQAIAFAPHHAEACFNLGNVLKDQGKGDEAAECYRQAITLKPDYAEAYNNLAFILTSQGKREEAVAIFRQSLALDPHNAIVRSNLLFSLNSLASRSISNYLTEARHYGREATAKVSKHFFNWTCTANPEQLCVGLVSGDFRNHSVGYFLEDLLANIDAKQIKLIAYPTNLCEDALTTRIRSRFIAWKPLVGMKDEAAANMIHGDGIHILVDLAGHTNYNRLPVFAWKPAPIQVSWLGYSASTGLQEMDYLLADPYVVPPGEEAHFTETIFRLPESYLCFSPPREAVSVGPLPALKEGRITFGSFNNVAKMNDKVVALWARILHAIPDSRLILKSEQFAAPGFCESIRQRFAACDISEGRLCLEAAVRQRDKHLANYNRVDIALDPFPYNGTTTSVEALWMGVPLITLRGNCFLAHVGESIACNAGLHAWIAADEEDYMAKAVAFANDVQALASLRAGLRQQVLASPLFNGPRFARNFEAALWGMWEAAKAHRGLNND